MKEKAKKWLSCLIIAAMVMSEGNVMASDFSDGTELSLDEENTADDIGNYEQVQEDEDISEAEQGEDDSDEDEADVVEDVSPENSDGENLFTDSEDLFSDNEKMGDEIEFGANVPLAISTDLSSEIYVAQQGKTTCTLASAAMMIKARFYKSNNGLWRAISESSIRSTAWIEGSGLRHSWTYKIDGNSVSVKYCSTSGISVSSLKSLLNNHPEGIVLYCGKLPHAVFLTDYDGDTFYCADPIQSYSGKRIALLSSYLGKKYGSQANILKNVTAYWYIDSYTISGSNPTPIPTQPVTTTPSIWKNSDNYTVGDYVKFNWNSVEYATGYWFSVWYKGEQIVTTQVSENSEYTLYNLKEGEYTAFIKAYNESSSKENSISLTVKYPTGEDEISNGKYQICSALDNSSVVSVSYASTSDEANVILHENEHHTNQIFNFEYLNDGYYKISAEHSGKYLDVYDSKNESGANVQQYYWKDGDNQKWVIKEAGDGYFYLISKCNGLYLDVYGGKAENYANIDTYSGHGGASEKWRLIPCVDGQQEIEDGIYTIQSALDNKYKLNVKDKSNNSEANIQLGIEEDTYEITYIGEGNYQIVNVNSGKSLDAYSSDDMQGKGRGTNVQQYQWNGEDNQKWILHSAGNGQYYVICRSNGLYLDVHGGKEGNGINVDLWSGNGTTGQQWKFVPVKQEINKFDVRLSSDNYIYDGNEKRPETTIKNVNTVLQKDTDYTINYTNNINAGTATITITGIGKYTGTVTKQFTINKASQELTVSVDKTNLSIGENTQIKVSGQGQITYKSSDEDKVTVSSTGMLTGKSAGAATITVTVAGTQNYNSSVKKIDVNVQKNCVGNKHNWDNGKITRQATCTEQGVKTYTCTTCGSTKIENISATGHKWNNGKITKAATCTEVGTRTYTCTTCQKIKTECMAATGHKEVKDAAIVASCETAGKTEGSHCSVCNTVLKEQKTVAALGHKWDNGKITKAATCTETGTKTYTCTTCQKIKTERMAATGHKEVKDAAVTETCEKEGKTEGSHCSVCNTVLKEQKTVAASGHKWDNGKITKAATCIEAGIRTYTCITCQKTKTESIEATGHKEVKDAAIAATCETVGKTEGSHCSVCNTVLKEQETVVALGHEWDNGEVTKAATCTEAGTKTYTCATCKKTKTEGIKAAGHTKIIKFVKKASCISEGYSGDVYCIVCGELLQEGKTVDKLSHTWTDWEKISDATVQKPEKQQRTCTVCKTVESQDYGEKLKSVMKVNYSTITLKTKQSFNNLRISGMAKGDYVSRVRSGNSRVVKVVKYTKDGKIQLCAQGKAGNTKLTIRLAGGAVKRINVKVTAIKTTALKVSVKKVTLKPGASKRIKATVVPTKSQEKITYVSSASKIATVSRNGVIKAKKRGMAKITVKSGTKTQIITVTVK